MNVNRQTTVLQANNKESKMKITTPKLIRWAGLSAMVAGIIFAGIQPIHPPDVLSSVNTSAFITITSFKTAMSLFGLFGIAGLYARQVEQTGWLGLAGYLLLTSFYAVQMCYAFVEPLILPLLTTVAPTFVDSALGMGSGAGGPMNLGAFAIVTILGRSEDKFVNLADYAGLAAKRPGLAAALSIFLLSLAGVPGTAGFAGKFLIFRAALESRLVWLTIIGVVTTVISFYYYLYVIVQMYMREPKDEFADVAVPGTIKLALFVSAVGTLYLGVLPTSVLNWTSSAALNTLR